MNLSQNTQRLFRRTFLKVAIFDTAILVVLAALSVLFVTRAKTRLAEQLAESFRAPLIAGDNRQIILDMPRPVLKDFRSVIWHPEGNGYSFSVPAGLSSSAGWGHGSLNVNVFFDEHQTILAGRLEFMFNRWEALPIAVFSWLLLAALSVLIGHYEWKRLLREYKLSVESQINETRASMAAQLAHDIRSPLAALGAAACGMNLPPEQKALIDGAVGRMQGIADDLLKRYRAPDAAAEAAKHAFHALNPLLAQVVTEKRLQHGSKPGVKIEYPEPAGEIKALVEPKEFQRLVSNLVNNAVEAFERGGTVKISLAALDGKALLTVQDDGKGMPAELLARMGQKGATQGKAGGTGLGVYHAKASVESWGGAFRIASAPGNGTTVIIELPRLEQVEAPRLAVLLDDDALAHMNWRMAARAAGAELKACKTPAELEAALSGLPKSTPVYIDSELGDGAKGEDIAKGLHDKGYTDLSMATGHGAENFAHLPWLKVAGKEPPWA